MNSDRPELSRPLALCSVVLDDPRASDKTPYPPHPKSARVLWNHSDKDYEKAFGA